MTLPFVTSSTSETILMRVVVWLWVFLTAPTGTRQICICYQNSEKMCVHLSVFEVWRWISFQAPVWLRWCCYYTCCWPPGVGETAAGSWRLVQNLDYNQMQNFLGERRLDCRILFCLLLQSFSFLPPSSFNSGILFCSLWIFWSLQLMSRASFSQTSEFQTFLDPRLFQLQNRF